MTNEQATYFALGALFGVAVMLLGMAVSLIIF